MSKPCLLSVVELGGYPNFTGLYADAGFDVEVVPSVRKALVSLKKRAPDLIVAEFNFQSDFRDRTSSLESLLAVVQRMPDTEVIVFYDMDQAHQLTKLTSVFPVYVAMPYPVDKNTLEENLKKALIA